MPADQPDARDLRERVSDLEATISDQRERLDDQQETIQKLMPSRRQALAGAGLLGGGLLGGRLSTGTARAEGSSGQVGTDTDPVDVKAWDLDVQNGATFNGSDLTGVGTLDVDAANIGKTGGDFDPADRPLISNESKTITVGTDTSTIQEALDMVPRILRHTWTIDIPNGTYNENLAIGNITVSDSTDGTQGAAKALKIQGDPTNPSNVQVNSLYVTSVVGNATPIINGLEFTADTPYVNENFALHAHVSDNVYPYNVSFTSGPTNGIQCYGGRMKIGGVNSAVDFGSGLETAIQVKRGGKVMVRDNGTTGTTTGPAHNALIGEIWMDDTQNVTGSPTAQASQGKVYDLENGVVVGPHTFNELSTKLPSGVSTVGNIRPSTEFITSDEFTLADGATKAIFPNHYEKIAGLVWAVNTSDNQAALFSTSGPSITKLEDGTGSWAASDTDGSNNLFRDSNSDLIVKNRVGVSKNYQFFMIAMSP